METFVEAKLAAVVAASFSRLFFKGFSSCFVRPVFGLCKADFSPRNRGDQEARSLSRATAPASQAKLLLAVFHRRLRLAYRSDPDGRLVLMLHDVSAPATTLRNAVDYYRLSHRPIKNFQVDLWKFGEATR